MAPHTVVSEPPQSRWRKHTVVQLPSRNSEPPQPIRAN